ncbi:thiamine pyrophosphate-binding protein [Lachnospiraceae bacterium 45-W7]
MTVSEYIFDFLQKKGVETVYMVSGSSSMWLTDSLYKNKKLHAVCTHHEQAAAMAADLSGRMKGIPGAALVTIGPGATNAITGVAEAYVDSSPLFVISGQASSKLLRYEQESGIRQHGTQSLDLEPLVSSITKYFAAVMNPADIRYHMERAYFEAMDKRRGPVWIDVPVDIQNRQVPENMAAFNSSKNKDTETAENAAEKDIQEILHKISKAERPLLLAGGGISKESVFAITGKLHIPVVTSRMGIDRIVSDSPYYVGRIGAYGQRAAHFAVQQADVLLVIGCRLSVSSIGYYPDRFGAEAYKIQIDIDPKELDKTDVPINKKICMLETEFTDKLLKLETLNCNNWLSYCMSLRAHYPVVEKTYQLCSPLNSYYFTDILSRLAPENAVVVVDTGSVCNVASQTWSVKKEQQYFISGGLSCMGFWAGAIGCCTDGKPVIALSGDGSVSMNVQEFATLRYYNLPVKLFVYQNDGYMLIRHNQHNYMEDRFLGVGPESGVKTPDFCKVAAAYGIPGIQISYGDNIEEKIIETLSFDGPAICQVMLEQFGPLAPRIASKVMPDGSLRAAEFDDLAPFLAENEKPTPFSEIPQHG